MNRLFIYLTSLEDQPPVSSEEVAAFMPAPQALVEIDRTPYIQ